MNKRLRFYMRGLGIGMLVAAILLTVSHHLNTPELTDEQVRQRAEAMGMVDGSAFSLSDAQEAGKGTAQEPAQPEEPGAETAESPAEKPAEEADAQPDAADPGASSEGLEAPSGDGLSGEDAQSPADGEASGEDASKPADAEKDGVDASEPSDGDGAAGAEDPEEADSGEPADDPEQQGQEPSGKDGGAQDGKGEDPKETEDIAPGTLVTVVIRSGQGSEAVAKSAEAAGLVADAKEFDRYLEQNGYSRRLRVGTYEIPMGATMKEIAEIFTSSRK
ncbi:MAG: hypothetical protein K6E81_10285 [Lachnospiraceae bacterium]|nr:hypothetical protein [Lachnospiraceae bacterium]